jgi:hypothetical protein
MRFVSDPAHRVEHAKSFLSGLLARGPVEIKTVRKDAATAGWSSGAGWAAIKHAKQELGLRAFRQNGAWYWGWPEAVG